MSKLLFDEQPLVIQPVFAKLVGLNESIIIQQLHYWLQKSNHFYEGRKWIYNTYPDWQEQFPFWSEKTIKRTITKLENEGYILTGNFNKLSFDRTKWYSLNYEMLVSRPWGQNDPTIGTTCPHHEVNLSPPIPEITTENTSDKKDIYTLVPENAEQETVSPPIPYKEIVDYLNEKTGKKYKHNTDKTRSFIKARFEDGFSLDDFKHVVDVKTAEWMNTKDEKYLRPETLFGNKFEGYLNQKLPTTKKASSYEVDNQQVSDAALEAWVRNNANKGHG